MVAVGGEFDPGARRHMTLNIKDPETEKLAAEAASMAGESKTRAVKVALEERKRRLILRAGRGDDYRGCNDFSSTRSGPKCPGAYSGSESRGVIERQSWDTGERGCDRRGLGDRRPHPSRAAQSNMSTERMTSPSRIAWKASSTWSRRKRFVIISSSISLPW